MIEFLATASFLLILAFFVACFVKFTHYSIGEPHEDQNGLNFVQGRIFSFYGAFVLRKHNEYDTKERTRLNNKIKNKLKADDPDFNMKAFRIQSAYRPSIWLPLGVCPMCFSFWLGLIIWVPVLLFFNISLLWAFLTLPASSMMLARL